MRYILTTVLLFSITVAFAQVDSVSLKTAMADLDRAMISKDQKALTRLLHDEVTYGHSNAWVQTKTDVLNDVQSGKLAYTKIENASVMIAAINPQWATVRTNTIAEGTGPTGSTFQLKLHVLQVWLKTKSGWQLIARQATKL